MHPNGSKPQPSIKAFTVFAFCSDGKHYRVPVAGKNQNKLAKFLARIGGGNIVTEAKPLENPDDEKSPEQSLIIKP